MAIDLPHMTEVCLQALAAQGCRSVGLMCAPPEPVSAEWTPCAPGVFTGIGVVCAGKPILLAIILSGC